MAIYQMCPSWVLRVTRLNIRIGVAGSEYHNRSVYSNESERAVIHSFRNEEGTGSGECVLFLTPQPEFNFTTQILGVIRIGPQEHYVFVKVMLVRFRLREGFSRKPHKGRFQIEGVFQGSFHLVMNPERVELVALFGSGMDYGEIGVGDYVFPVF